MSVEIIKEKGWTEAVLDGNCDYDKFYLCADILKDEFNVKFTGKLNDFDSYYWDFDYEGTELTLHYNVYLGVSVLPKAFKLASSVDNEKAIEIAQMVYDKLSNKNSGE